MACNCGKKQNQNKRPIALPRQGRIVSAQNNRVNEVQALSAAQGLNSSRRNVERKRREIIFKKLGRT